MLKNLFFQGGGGEIIPLALKVGVIHSPHPPWIYASAGKLILGEESNYNATYKMRHRIGVFEISLVKGPK